jgi:hypothetical protein
MTHLQRLLVPTVPAGLPTGPKAQAQATVLGRAPAAHTVSRATRLVCPDTAAAGHYDSEEMNNRGHPVMTRAGYRSRATLSGEFTLGGDRIPLCRHGGGA